MPPPGVTFLTHLTLKVFSKPVVLGFGVHYVSKCMGFSTPVWTTVLLSVGSLLLYIFYRVVQEGARQRKDANALGARLAPTAPGKWPGNLDFLRMLIHNRAHGYPGKWPGNLDFLRMLIHNRAHGYPADGFTELLPDVGPVMNTRVLWTDAILTVWPEHIKIILASDFNNYVKGERFQSNVGSVLGVGVFNADGEMWKFHRNITRPFFSRDKISHFDIFDSHASDVIRIMKDRMRGGYSIDFEALEMKGDIEAETLLDELLNSTSDPKVLKDETLNILLAGRDTTMHTTTMVVYFLSMYPDTCARLRDEVLTHVGPTRRPTYDDIKNMRYLRAVINESLRLYPSVPFNTRESIKATTWPSPDPAQKPIYIPAGTKVPYSVFIMHRLKDLWGPDAEEFSPDRFLDERLKKYLINNPFQFLPFNGGPRICLGQQFAYNEMSFMLIRLLQSFSSFSLDQAACSQEGQPPAEWAAAPGRKGIDKFRPKAHFTMYSEGGMWIKAADAEAEN
ncbi:cytochrome P450 [Mycena alexandri]|uniref:Cytochrome P450 n=1 Tax=Mycena alexandri TaxID=1745969 RepID=A0AAD6SY20_9AGAR|nr:cytochrome P450 [Mycena alexandri]